MGLIQLTEEERPREVWVSGTEIVRYAQDLIDGLPRKRRSGRTKRLACKYAELAMKFPNCKVMLKDHYRTLEADRLLLREVIKILDALKIDYEMGELDSVLRDPDSFTGAVQNGKVVFIKATPKTIEQI